jgi:crossover junction endodeoxyribonuclease RuvC
MLHKPCNITDTGVPDSFWAGLHMLSLRVLGCDPGLGCTGWGVIEIAGSKLSHIANGVIETAPPDSLGARLAILHAALADVIRAHHPDAVAVEQAFVAKDASAALKLGHARAVALLAAAEAGIEIAEYTPNHVKKSVVGVGHANKEQIQAMVRRLLPAVQFEAADAADALAVAIAHVHLSQTNARIAAATVAL